MNRLCVVFLIGVSFAVDALGAQARSLPLSLLVKAKNSEPQAIESQPLPFNLPSGRSVVAQLRIPPRIDGQRLPVLLVFGGFEHARQVVDLIHPKAPIIVASFDYPFDAPRKFEFPDSLRYASMAKQAINDTIAGIQELHSLLEKRIEVDARKITVVGASFGAPFALAAAAADPGIKGVVLIHGFGNVPETAMNRLLKRWRPQWGILAYPMSWLLAHLGWIYFNTPSPEESARGLLPDQRVLMISAKEDSFVPQESSDALWHALEKSRAQHERVFTSGDHVQPGSQKLIDDMTTIVTAWMQKVEML